MQSHVIGRRNILRIFASATALAGVSALAPFAASAATGRSLYRDAKLPVELRVKDLLSQMTLEEKVGQIIALWATKSEIMDSDLSFNPAKASVAYPNSFGQITRPSDRRGGQSVPAAAGGTVARWREPANTVQFINDVQRWATTKTRLGIPVLFHEEALHGYMAPHATMFPQAIALAGTFDADLMERVSSVIGREVRVHGSHLALSPVVDIVRDPRWGRIEETFGEDPYLVGEMGVAAVNGLQGNSKTLAPGKVFATLKHMTGHGQPQAGNNIGPAQISERELRENFFPPFKAVVKRTGIGALMPSYNEIDGIPSHSSTWLLRDILRGEWGFDGLIVSDYGAVDELSSLHKLEPDLEGTARLALAASVDSELPDGKAFRTLVTQVREGKVAEAAIDEACGRMLSLKFRAGLFENPYADAVAADRLTGNAEAQALALEAARRSICLLTNDGTLPLTAGAHKTVAVIGPNTAIARLGGYSGAPRRTVTLLDAVRKRLTGKAEVVHAQGVFITQSEDRSIGDVKLADPVKNGTLIAEAVEVARRADVILLSIGDTEQTSREGFAKNHLGDRTTLDLLGEQNELFDALHALGKPVVVVAQNGRPPSWLNVAAKANAILECWYVGQEGGTAMAEAVFGDINPGAKLPVTVAREAGQIPLYYNAKPTTHRGYLFSSDAPLFPFGHGLSYTKFTLSPPRLSSAKIAKGDNVTVEVDVHNAGNRAGDEVVQIYVHDQIATVTRPVMELKAFKRVTLAAGERKTVSLTIDAEALHMWNRKMQFVIEPGKFDIMAGPNSVDLQSTVLEIV
jgi:beta-glucosidase